MAKILICFILAYLIGSLPWGLIIGKLFFNTDIREFGSGNLGGTNAGRVLGLRYGILVILLDGLKAFIMMFICNKLAPGYEPYVGLMVCMGHCYPVFANFKGGKAVATSYGYLLGLAVFVMHDYMLFIIPLVVFFTLLFISKMVSLSSMCSLIAVTIYTFFIDRKIAVLILLLALFVIYRHRSNVKRIINGTESKFTIKKS